MKLEGIIKILGLILMSFAVIINPLTIEYFFSPDKQFDFIWKYFVIQAFDIFIFLMGILIIIYSSNIIIFKESILKKIKEKRKTEREKLRYKIRVFLLIFGCIVLFIILILIELSLFINSDLYYVYPPNIKIEFEINSSLSPGIYNNSVASSNMYGYRGTPIDKNSREKEYRILAIGGSTTIDLLLDDKETWTHLLEKNLNVSNDGRKVVVINVGKAGYKSYEHLIYLKVYYEQFNPDLVIILMGVNDVGSYLFSKKEGGYLKIPETKKLFFSSPYNSKREKLTQSFETIKIKLNKYPFQKELNEYYKDLLKFGIIKEYKLPPEIGPGLNNYENNIQNIINFSEEENIKLILMTQPTIFKENYSEREINFIGFYRNKDGKGYEFHIFKYFMDEYNKKLLEKCNESKNKDLIYCFNLDERIPKNLDYFYDGVHFNENGAKKVADEISNFIKINLDDF
ncbi:MAG: SGNH/GDSL hydrolase family protein [Candidatus Pacearchaeota archaeon]